MAQANTIRASKMDYIQPNKEEQKDFQPKIRQTYPRLNILYLLRFCIAYAFIYAAGYAREFISLFLPNNRLYHTDTPKNIKAGIHTIMDGYTGFYVRNVFLPLLTCFERPVLGAPSAQIEIKERRRKNIFSTTFEHTGRTLKTLNFGSYNYLGKQGNYLY